MTTGSNDQSWEIRVLYDGDCPLCAREIRFLERRDKGRGRIQFEDIADENFDPGRYGLNASQVMARIHGVRPDGTVVEGVEVFQYAYSAVGLGWLVAPTRWPGLRQLATFFYRIFARNRLRWTGREEICDQGACGIETPATMRDAQAIPVPGEAAQRSSLGRSLKTTRPVQATRSAGDRVSS